MNVRDCDVALHGVARDQSAGMTLPSQGESLSSSTDMPLPPCFEPLLEAVWHGFIVTEHMVGSEVSKIVMYPRQKTTGLDEDSDVSQTKDYWVRPA